MTTPNDILKHYGKSFHFASLVLDRETTERCARLYAFCRYVDDLADENDDPVAARADLMDVIKSLKSGETLDPTVADFIALADQLDMSVAPAIDLVQGVLEDLNEVRIRDVGSLHNYCYRVAGTVGLLMCGVLGVRDARAYPFAIDLGIGMQLTNIARDVLEDAVSGRRYIPATVIGDVDPDELIEPDAAMQRRIVRAVSWLLEEADRFYRSGEAGLVFLPSRARLAIMIASRVYHRIGVRLRNQEFAVWNGRTVVSFPAKLAVGVGAAGSHWQAQRRSNPLPLHAEFLHRWLQNTTSIYS